MIQYCEEPPWPRGSVLVPERQSSNFKSCVWRAVSSYSSHHLQEVLLARFSLYVHQGGLRPHSFHFNSLLNYQPNTPPMDTLIFRENATPLIHFDVTHALNPLWRYPCPQSTLTSPMHFIIALSTPSIHFDVIHALHYWFIYSLNPLWRHPCTALLIYLLPQSTLTSPMYCIIDLSTPSIHFDVTHALHYWFIYSLNPLWRHPCTSLLLYTAWN